MIARVKQRLQSLEFRRAAIVISTFAAFLGLLFTPAISPHQTTDSYSYEADAEALLHGRYSIPLPAVDISDRVVPVAARGLLQRDTYRTPGYPALLALVGGGTSSVSRGVLYLVQALLYGATVLLVMLTARRVWGEQIALLGGFLYAIDPWSKRYVSLVLTEILAGFLIAAALYMVARARERHSTGWWALAGFTLGAATLVRPSFVVVLPIVALFALFSQPQRRQRLLAASVCLLCGLALLGPWVGWASNSSGRLVLTSFGEGWNLLLAADGEGLGHTSSQVTGSPSFMSDINSVHRFAPTVAEFKRNPNAESRYLAHADAVERRLATTLYTKGLDHSPAHVVGQFLYRGYFLWMAHEDWYQPTQPLALLPLRIIDWAALAFASIGAAIAFRRRGVSQFIVVLLVLFTAFSALQHVEARYTYPFRGFYLCLVALALSALWTRYRQQPQSI
jgi:hypothetical protein